MPEPAHVQAEWARLLMASFSAAGVRDVVISPGSRSTPYVLAARDEERLRCHSLADERSAAFFALGQARLSGRPSLLLCTSGSAGANYFPAVVEAGAAHVPLLALTCDRPVELQAAAANQTIDQLSLFGSHARRFFDLGAPEAGLDVLRGLRRLAAQAVFESLYPTPGAVHLNVRARKPLEPEVGDAASGRKLRETVDHLIGSPIVRPHRPILRPAQAALGRLAAECAEVEEGLIVCGPAPISASELRPAIDELARRSGFPVLAEAASQQRFWAARAPGLCVDAFDSLLHCSPWHRRHRPRLVIQVGRPPTSGLWDRYLDDGSPPRRWVLAEHGWGDAANRADELLFGDLGSTLAELNARLEPTGRAEGGWATGWLAADRLAWRAVEEETADDALGEGAAAREVARALPSGALFAVSNSLPIRMVDTYCRGGTADLRVWSQRGASGIDGILSGAAGCAGLAASPAALLVGDVSFLHDLSGMAALRQVETPLVVVVVNNDGGRIFEQLPLAEHPAAEPGMKLWTTPHGRSLAPAAELYGFDYARCETRRELREELALALSKPGCTVLEARVPPQGARAQNRRLWQRLERALEEG